ncbi:MAG: hypothetical protein AB9907_06675 [Flexilinea sp.]
MIFTVYQIGVFTNLAEKMIMNRNKMEIRNLIMELCFENGSNYERIITDNCCLNTNLIIEINGKPLDLETCLNSMIENGTEIKLRIADNGE